MAFSPDVLTGARFATAVPRFLSRQIGVAEAQAVVRRRLECRQADFLTLVEREVFANPVSPYLQLLRQAGCDSGDLQALVAREGLEGALKELRRGGVYLTNDELKGRKPIVRGSQSWEIEPGGLNNRQAEHHLTSRTSGSRGGGSQFRLSLDFVRERSYNKALQLAARGAFGWKTAPWGVPGGSVIGQILQYSACGEAPERWFSQVDPAAPGLHARYRWSTRILRWSALAAGVRLPAPEHVPLDDPLPIVRWMSGHLRDGETPFIYTFASCAVRICRAAEAAGMDLAGAQFTLGGEPTTSARLAAIERVGARGVPNYAIGETGRVANGCLAPAAPDDVHLLHDLVAVIQSGEQGASGGLPARALLVTSLRETSPLILLNVSLGDEADLFERPCGCPFEGFGYATHLQNIRSFEKLTAGGMSFQDTEVIRVLEEVLPRHFGGGPNDYQLVEEEGPGGLPSVGLLVHPRIGTLDDREVLEVLLDALGPGDSSARVMAAQWRSSGVLSVVREAPRTSANGKIQHLRQEARALARR